MKNQTNMEWLRGELWSTSLKYLDFMRNYEAESSEEYYVYRDTKGRELRDEVVELVRKHIDDEILRARIEEIQKIKSARFVTNANYNEWSYWCETCQMMLEEESQTCGCDHVTDDRLKTLMQEQAEAAS